MTNDHTGNNFNDILENSPPSLRPLCEALRSRIVALHSEAVELVWPKQRIASFGVGPSKMKEHYAYIGVYKSHVNLGFYHGASLPDPKGLLEGSGNNLRHIKIRSMREAEAPEVEDLLRQGLAECRRNVG